MALREISRQDLEEMMKRLGKVKTDVLDAKGKLVLAHEKMAKCLIQELGKFDDSGLAESLTFGVENLKDHISEQDAEDKIWTLKLRSFEKHLIHVREILFKQMDAHSALLEQIECEEAEREAVAQAEDDQDPGEIEMTFDVPADGEPVQNPLPVSDAEIGDAVSPLGADDKHSEAELLPSPFKPVDETEETEPADEDGNTVSGEIDTNAHHEDEPS